MLPGLLHIRSLLDSSILQFKQSLHATPTLHETLTSLRSHLADLLAKMYMAMQVTSFSTVYSFISRWFMKVGKLCIEVLDWLLLPRMVWTVTVRHAFALLVLYAVKVFVQIAVIPIGRSMVRFARPFFINREYLQQEKLLQQRLDNANDYLDWKKSANELDRLQGRYHWKESSQSPYYDWRRIRDDLQRFRQLVDAGDVRGIMAFSRSRLLRNLVGINDRRLYSRLRAGTKRLIEEYVSEVVRALQLVCVIETPLTCSEYEKCVGGILHDAAPSHVSTAEKLSFFNETRHAFGRSALLLSGGATLGLYHIGVCKALHDNKLLPRVLSGSSVGSIICAMVGTRTDEELEDVFATESNSIKLNFFPPNGGSVKRKIARLFSQGVLMDIKILKKCVKANVPALTFQEAYELSGRIINIVVSPASGSGNQDSLRLLNYLTAPNVLVWSAALASCAIPGVYAPVELMKKDEKTGKLVPYMEGNMPIKWEDGSVQADLPMQRLSELFNINHFIVSQCNPHVIPFVSSASSTHTLQQSFLSSPLSKTIDYLSSQLKTTALNFLNMNMMPIHPSVKYILDQKYLGDVTLVPDVSPGDYTKLLVNPTAERLRECIIISERSTWRLIPVIRGACEIEFALDECVRRMRGTLILEELNDARMKHQQQAMSRVRSWSSDLLAVGNKHKQPLHEEKYDEDEEEGETTGPSPPAAKVHSLYNLAEPERYRLQTEPDRYRLQPGEKNANVKRSSTVMGLAEDGEQPVQPLSKRFDHQPEADDILSDDEEIEQQPKAVKPSNQAEGEGEVPCIDDEGIPRSKPVLSAVSSANNIAEATPQASVQTIDINSNVMNGVTPTFNSSPEKTPLTAASTSSEPMPQRPQVSPILLQPSPNNPHVTANHTAPLPPLSAINSALRTNKPRLNPPSKRVNIDERAPGWIPPAVPLSVLTKDGVSGESLSVPPVITSIQELSPRPAEGPSSYEPPIKVPTRSPSGSLSQLNAERKFKRRSSLEGNMATSSSAAALASPRTSDVTTHLSAEEWDEEKNAGRLTQLLRTTQSKLSVSGSPLQQKKKRVNLHSATPVDVSVHIPSLVTFRPTGPRRMSALDLQMLDQADDDPNSSSSAPVPNIKVLPPPAGLMQRAATEPKQEYEPSDDDDDDLEHRRPPSQPMDAQEGTLGRWLNRASSFFRRDSDASSAAGLNQSHNATPQPTSPRSYSSSSSNSGATSPVQAETPAVPCSPSQRKKISASSSSSTSKPAILRAASQGLPRALSQLELISDVGTMP